MRGNLRKISNSKMETSFEREIQKLLTLAVAIVMCVNYGEALKGKDDSPQSRPNIIFIMADDLDVNLGSTDVLKKTKRILQDEGVTFTNAFTTSPLCCPSRSSILTGRYAHNHHVNSNNKNCSGPAWIEGPEKQNFGKLLQDSGYVTAYFGKYLNNYLGDRVPPGWNHWSGLVRNSRFYNYSINVNGKIVKYKNDYKKDYFTDVMTNASIDYFTKIKSQISSPPLMMVLSMSAPHGPEDSAPQYQDTFKDVKAPRHPNYNYTSLDKHWIIRQTPPLDETKAFFTDILYRKRLQTLLSVDDAIEKIYNMLLQIGMLEKTYIIFTSDHGYHLGQFNQVKGKSQPYESDVRIPLFMRGPRIPKGVNISSIALNIDLAPTFLDIANAEFPNFIDGTSLMDHAVKVLNKSNSKVADPIQQIWKDTFLIERGKLTPATVDDSNITFPGSKKANKICQSYGFPKPPCTPDKKVVCYLKKEVLYYQQCYDSGNCTCKETKSKTTVLHVSFMSKVADPAVVLTDNPGLNSLKSNNAAGIENFLLHLEKKFERLKRRIKRHGVKFFNRYSRSDVNIKSSIPSYAKNTSDENTDDIELKIKRSKERLLYWKNERSKLANLAIYKSVASKIVDHVKDSAAVYLHKNNDTCLCSSKEIEKEKKVKKKKINNDMNCFRMNQNHWKVPPLWTGPEFTACTNSPNSTYWCLRTINTTHNFLYCEFITGFKEYFDINKDPYQLYNIISTVQPKNLANLHSQLNHMRECKSSHGCLLRSGRNLSDKGALFKKWRRFERKKRQFLNSFGSLNQ